MSRSEYNLEGEVREGLLCPVCLQDLRTVSQLQEHFELAHCGDDHDVFQSLKGFIGKAKRKILKQETWGDSRKSFEDDIPHLSHIYPSDCDFSSFEPQELGKTSCHIEYFKKVRGNKVDRYVIETNKLLIRLDKLISDAPDDPEKRKAHEKKIVPWVADTDVRLCPGCARSFGLSRRRHHCRLCGGIMCHACSEFLEFTYARKLIHPVVSHEMPTRVPNHTLQRRSSSTSLLSVVSATGEAHIRVCHDCKTLLFRRDQQVEQHTLKPIVVQIYERMKGEMEEVERLLPLYYKITDSLSTGETAYSLSEGHEVRIKLLKMAENIDLLSKKISTHGTQDSLAQSPRVLQLQGGVRLAANQFLRNNLLGLPPLPSEQDVARNREIYHQEVQRRIQQEKQAVLEAHQLREAKKEAQSASPRTPLKKDLEQVSVEDGWSVINFIQSDVSPEEDPMVQQINIIRNYIHQARLDHKYDEVHMLEANLKELQQEYIKQQQAVNEK